ncbi:MAG: hypothetical protein JOZ83_09565 [Silvibacterium sp.]|nr:hypothetical protein [Silvibacterium sp.]
MKTLWLFTLILCLAAGLGACSSSNRGGSPAEPKPTPQEKKAAIAERDTERQQLEQIPPPAKNRYMAIHTKEGWGNPFLIVGKKTVTMRVMNPEPPQSDVVPGNLMHPPNARKRELELRLSDLPEALASIPENSWPYGRVVAVEEDAVQARADRIQVRRNVETTIQVLNDLGIVVYEWPSPGMLR